MPEGSLAERTAAAARMLLAPPDAALLAALAPVAEEKLDPERARQDFYDFLCIVQSGCHVPPYVHVLARAEKKGEYWHFPPPRFDGGDGLRPWYEAAGFDPAALAADPLIAGANRPLDHLGFVLAFLSRLLRDAESEEEARLLAALFIADTLGPGIDLLAELLARAESPYIALLGCGLAELLGDLRAAFPAPLPVEGP